MRWSSLALLLQRHQHIGADGSNTLGAGVVTIPMLASGVDATAYSPVLSGTGTAGTFTYDVQVGRYCRIGPLVFYSFFVNVSAASVAPTGNMQVSLPVASANISNLYGASAIEISGVNLTAGYSYLIARIAPNTSVISLQEVGDNVSASQYPAASVAYPWEVNGTVVYFAA